MTIKDQIRDKKLQNNIIREAAKMSAYHQLSMNQVGIIKYEYLTSEEILPSSQQQIIEQAEFT